MKNRKWQEEIYDLKTIFDIRESLLSIDTGRPGMEVIFPRKPFRPERLGVLSFSANPPTTAHLEMALSAKEEFNLSAVLFLISVENPDKPFWGASFEDRLIMLKMALVNPNCETVNRRNGETEKLQKVESENQQTLAHSPTRRFSHSQFWAGLVNRGRFVDQSTALFDNFSGTEIYFIVGSDTIERVLDPKYYKNRDAELKELFSRSRFIVVPRYGSKTDDVEDIFSKSENRKFRDSILHLSIKEKYLYVSSSSTRERAAKGESIDGPAPPAADFFIKETGLYLGSTRLDNGEEIDRYRVRNQLITHLFAIKDRLEEIGSFRKAVRTALSPSYTGKSLRKVLLASSPKRLPDPLKRAEGDILMNFEPLHKKITAQEASAEAKRCLQCKRPPCEKNCPINNPVRPTLSLIADGDYKAAFSILAENNVYLPVSGLLCQSNDKYCKSKCTMRKTLGPGAGVAIQEIFYSIWEWGIREDGLVEEVINGLKAGATDKEKKVAVIATDKEKKVAVIGAGPAGLSAAFHIAIKGFRVIIFEASDFIGGLPRMGIPNFRISIKDTFDYIKNVVKLLRIEVRYNSIVVGGQDSVIGYRLSGKKYQLPVTGYRLPVTGSNDRQADGQKSIRKKKEIRLDDLRREGFKSVFIGVGAGSPVMDFPSGSKNRIKGDDLKGITNSIDFFKNIRVFGRNKLYKIYTGKTVLVIDSGNTAMDTARTLRRLGARAIIVDFRSSPRALRGEIAAAKKEGVCFKMGLLPLEFTRSSDDHVNGLRAARVNYDEESGEIKEKSGGVSLIDAQAVVYAIGSRPEFAVKGIITDSEGYITVNPGTMETSLPGIFAGGDVVDRQNITIAILHGKKAAEGIENFLS